MTDFRQKSGTQLRFCVSGSFSPTDPGTDFTQGTPTDVTLTLSGLADGAGRQSDKVSLGSPRAAIWSCDAAVDFTGETPDASGSVKVLWLPSGSSTQGTGNIAGNSGADGAAPDGALGSITLAEYERLGRFIGVLPTHDGAVVQAGHVGLLINPPTQWGQILLINESGDAFEADSGNVEPAVWLTPLVDTDDA